MHLSRLVVLLLGSPTMTQLKSSVLLLQSSRLFGEFTPNMKPTGRQRQWQTLFLTTLPSQKESDMTGKSILCQVIEGEVSPQTAIVEVEKWFGQIDSKITSTLKADPAVSNALATLKADAQAGINDLAAWGGTALATELSALAVEGEALVTKYATSLLGGANPVSAAGVTILQALLAVATAAIQNTVAQIQAAPATAQSGSTVTNQPPVA